MTPAACMAIARQVVLAWLVLWLLAAASRPAVQAAEASAGAGARFAWHNWSREDGLPQNSVTEVLQTQDGYIWVATYSGLARFDGVRFTVFDNNTDPELHNSRITSLFEADDGTLWIGHENGELTRYRDGQFTAVDYHVAWSGGKIFAMGTDAAGDLWLLNADGLLARLRDGRVLSPERGELMQVLNLTRSPQGKLWVARDGRVSELGAGDLQPLEFDFGQTNQFVQGIGASRDGGLWVFYRGHFQKWRNGQWCQAEALAPWDSDPLTHLVETRNGLLAAATSDRGLYVITPGPAGQAVCFSRTNGFPADWVAAVMEDREGNLWAGTGSSGVVRLRHTIIERVGPPDVWLGRPVKAVTASRDGSIWVGTEGAGLYRCQDGQWRSFLGADGLANFYVWTVAEDVSGQIWAGTWGGGLYLKQGEGFRLAPGFTPVTPPLTAIFCETNGCLWLGTALGLMRYEAGQGKLYPQAQAVRTVLKDRAGAIWFGMSGGGLGCLQDGVERHYGKADGLGSDFIQCLHEDEAGALWIGTFGGGLSRWQAGHFATLGRPQGLGDNVICDIEDDGAGCFWMSSFNGLLRVRQTSLNACADGLTNMIHCDTYGISDGMPTLECSGGSQPAGCRTPDGRLWFATSRGLVVVHSQEVKHNPLPPPVIIEKLLVDGELPAGGAGPGGRWQIPPGRHRLEFQYTGLSFAAPEKVAFRHRLGGLDADWIESGGKRTVDYDYIPPGDYTFQVMACNNDGVWSDPGAALAFTMLPYFWQTGWFRGLALAGLLLLAGGGAWYGTRRRMSRKLERVERQRALERERTRIAKDIHDDLGASLTRINLLSQSTRRGMEDRPQTLKNLDQICTTARQLTRALDEIVWAVDPQHDTLDSLASYLGILIHEQTADSGIRCRLDFPVHLPAWPVTAEVRHNLFLAFKEGLHNVVKHSGATEVHIAFALQPAGFAVTISDNGRGFDPAAGGAGRAWRNGLGNMRQRLTEIGGHCAIESRPGEGTQVIFSLPVREQSK